MTALYSGFAARCHTALAYTNNILQMALSQTLRLLQSYELAAVRCHMDVVEDPGNGTVTMLRVLAEPPLDAKMSVLALTSCSLQTSRCLLAVHAKQ
jgi:hypothetical protein